MIKERAPLTYPDKHDESTKIADNNSLLPQQGRIQDRFTELNERKDGIYIFLKLILMVLKWVSELSFIKNGGDF